MDVIPEGLIVKPQTFEKTGNPNVLNPTYGSVGSMHVEFRVHKKYSGADSAKANKEVRRETEICLFQADKFSRVPKKVSELSTKEQIALAPIYERFKTQSESNETSIFEWEAATQMEKAHLGQMGIWSVEQLAAMPEHERYRLGPGGADLHARSERHMATKKEDSQEEQKKEMALVMEENKKLSERLKALEERELQRHQEIAKSEEGPKKKRSRPKKEEAQEETTQEEKTKQEELAA